jgi:hypothetical protein
VASLRVSIAATVPRFYLGRQEVYFNGLLALPVPRHCEIATDHWDALLSRVGVAGRISIADLQRTYVSDGEGGFQMTPIDTKVGDWTYRRFVLAKPSKAPS